MSFTWVKGENFPALHARENGDFYAEKALMYVKGIGFIYVNSRMVVRCKAVFEYSDIWPLQGRIFAYAKKSIKPWVSDTYNMHCWSEWDNRNWFFQWVLMVDGNR